MNGVLIKRNLDIETQTHRRESRVKTEARVGGMHLQDREQQRECQPNQKLEVARKDSLKGVQPCQHLDFCSLSSRTVKGCISVV